MFNRQFILSAERLVNAPESFEIISKDGFFIYYHNEDVCVFYRNEFIAVYIIGIMIHSDFPELVGVDLLSSIFDGCSSFSDVNTRLNKACGRYVVICECNGKIDVRSDAVSLAQVYYDSSSRFICSDINLYLEFFSDAKINVEAYAFYNHTMKFKGNGDSWIGHETIYLNLFKLLPNHFITFNDFSVKRYWPNEKCIPLRVNDIVHEVAANLLSTFQAFQNIKPLSIAVTAGNDSRLALAVSSKLKNSCYYFIDKLDTMGDDDVDISIGKRLTNSLGFDFNIHQISNVDDVPDDFTRQYFKSCFYAKHSRLAVVYNYKRSLSGFVNICGVGEFGRSVFGWPLFPLTPNFLCHKYYYTNSKFANRMAELWLKEYDGISNLGYNPLALFYIEQKLGNWGAVCNCESDIAFEEVNPYASHFMIHHFISLVKEDSTYINNKLFHALTSSFQPSLMDVEINPVKGFKKRLKKKLRSYIWVDYMDYLIYIIKKVSRPHVN